MVSRVWAGHLTGPSLSLFLHHRYSRPIHLHIQDRNRLADFDGQVQLDGSLDLLLLTLSDILSNSFRRTLDRLGGHLQSGQDIHLLTAVVKESLLPHQGLHATHPGREFRLLNVQFHIGRKLAAVTARAKIVGARDLYSAHRGQQRPGTQLSVSGLLAARTSYSVGRVGRSRKV